jgi:Mor family transcriptional regulator
MSDIIRRAAKRLVSSPEFMDTFTELFTLELEKQLRAEAGGDRVYIAKTCGNTHIDARNERIRANCTGNNFRQLALDEGLSEKQIRRICTKKRSLKIGTSLP